MDFLFLFLNISAIWGFMVTAVFIPFYPPLANSRGFSNALIGFVFIFSPIGNISSSVILGKSMQNV